MYLFETRFLFGKLAISVLKINSLSFSLEGVSGEVFGSVFITAEDVEVVSVDLDVTTNW